MFDMSLLQSKGQTTCQLPGPFCRGLSQQIKNAWRTLWNPVKDTVDGQGLCHCADNGFTLCSQVIFIN